ncbi:MAG TPA: ferrous iron transport protein B [Verrucomicrobiae bacterium]
MAAAAQSTAPAGVSTSTALVALTGNPNCGKTTLFNALTGLRAKVGNYAGVTVERKEGRMLGTAPPNAITILDLPGTYSLSPQSLDEQISRDILFNRLKEVAAPSLVVVVVDASNLERNLYYATQVIELGYPTIVVLNMIDVAERQGHYIDANKLSDELGAAVVSVVANVGKGLPELRELILKHARKAGHTEQQQPRLFCELPESAAREVESVEKALDGHQSPVNRRAEALLVLGDPRLTENSAYVGTAKDAVVAARNRLEKSGVDWASVAIEGRYACVGEIARNALEDRGAEGEPFSDKLDRVLTHKFWGLLIFVFIMAVMFQSIFTFARIPMDLIDAGVASLGAKVGSMMPPGDLRSLLVDGVIKGVGAVIVFLPQICLLFLFIGFLEDTGYMARAAFLMDRLMSKVGLHGKSFIPMLSSFACAIPGIMATRTIETPKDRLATILVAPLMSCSARLPVYTLLIAACIPDKKIFGFWKLQGITMLCMYLLGIVVALLMAWLLKKTLLKGEPPLLIMELPPYKRPVVRVALRHMWDRSKLFLQRAGTVILGINILLWFLATYPRHAALEQQYEAKKAAVAADKEAVKKVDEEHSGETLRRSFAGMTGRAMEPLIKPLGFDWKIGIGLVASFAAREVFVSTMSTVYNIGEADDTEASTKVLADTLRQQTRPDGTRLYTPLLGVTLMVFYVFALQCVSTVAIVRRETNSWKWPAFQWAYMGALAWIFAFVTYQGGRLLGF